MRAPEFWNKNKSSWQAAALTPLAWAYQLGHRLRYLTSKSIKIDIPVACVGNVTAGGSGKTPVAIDIARHMALRKMAVHFLSRGYGGNHKGAPLRVDSTKHTAQRVGDEPLMLAHNATTWVSPNRIAGAKAAIAGGADLIIMDDGFQNPTLVKDLSILVFDGEYGIGNGALLPAGPLREPLAEALSRAHGAVVIGRDCHGISTTLSSTIPVFTAQFVPCNNIGDKERPVIAFAGIGRPEKFFSSLRSAGYHIAAHYAFPDHHRYTSSELTNLHSKSRKHGAQLMTTEKDFMRLETNAREGITPFFITLEWFDKEAFATFLDHQLRAY